VFDLLNLIQPPFTESLAHTSFWDDPTRKGQTLAMGQRLDIRGSHSYNVRGA